MNSQQNQEHSFHEISNNLGQNMQLNPERINNKLNDEENSSQKDVKNYLDANINQKQSHQQIQQQENKNFSNQFAYQQNQFQNNVQKKEDSSNNNTQKTNQKINNKLEKINKSRQSSEKKQIVISKQTKIQMNKEVQDTKLFLQNQFQQNNLENQYNQNYSLQFDNYQESKKEDLKENKKEDLKENKKEDLKENKKEDLKENKVKINKSQLKKIQTSKENIIDKADPKIRQKNQKEIEKINISKKKIFQKKDILSKKTKAINQGQSEQIKEEKINELRQKMHKNLLAIYSHYSKETFVPLQSFQKNIEKRNMIDLRIFLKYYKDFQISSHLKVSQMIVIFKKQAINGLWLDLDKFILLNKKIFQIEENMKEDLQIARIKQFLNYVNPQKIKQYLKISNHALLQKIIQEEFNSKEKKEIIIENKEEVVNKFLQRNFQKQLANWYKKKQIQTQKIKQKIKKQSKSKNKRDFNNIKSDIQILRSKSQFSLKHLQNMMTKDLIQGIILEKSQRQFKSNKPQIADIKQDLSKKNKKLLNKPTRINSNVRSLQQLKNAEIIKQKVKKNQKNVKSAYEELNSLNINLQKQQIKKYVNLSQKKKEPYLQVYFKKQKKSSAGPEVLKQIHSKSIQKDKNIQLQKNKIKQRHKTLEVQQSPKNYKIPVKKNYVLQKYQHQYDHLNEQVNNLFIRSKNNISEPVNNDKKRQNNKVRKFSQKLKKEFPLINKDEKVIRHDVFYQKEPSQKPIRRLEQAKIIVNSAKLLPNSQNIQMEKARIPKIQERKNNNIQKSNQKDISSIYKGEIYELYKFFNNNKIEKPIIDLMQKQKIMKMKQLEEEKVLAKKNNKFSLRNIKNNS